MNRIRFGVSSESIIKGALRQIHNEGVSLDVYNNARRAIGSDKQGYYILNTGSPGVVQLIEMAQCLTKDYKSLLPERAPAREGRNVFECVVCGWTGKGTGRDGALVEGDRCPGCGTHL